MFGNQQNRDYLDRALLEYAAASYHFELGDHRRYRANVENNLGVIYFEISRSKEAHEHLERARRLEHDLIKYALENEDGSLTRAANNLGISYQELHYMLETRHKDLVK